MSKFAIVGIFGFVLIAWAVVGMLPMKLTADTVTSGQIGDTFGAVNALFSGLAFAGLLITVMMQRDELKLQREELELQREEMRQMREEYARSAKAQEGSEMLLKHQIEVNLVATEIQGLTALLDAHIANGAVRSMFTTKDSLNDLPAEAVVRDLRDKIRLLKGASSPDQ